MARTTSAALLEGLLLAGLCGLGACGPSDGAEARGSDTPGAARTSALAADPRMYQLLAPCTRGAHYGVDLSDVKPVLVELLIHGDHDPMKRAKEELAAAGEPGLQAVKRVFEQYWNDPVGVNWLRNAIDTVAMSRGQLAHDLLMRTLDHPVDSIRILGLRALARHGQPQDYERVLALLGELSPIYATEVVSLLHELDAERAAYQYLEWLEDGKLDGVWAVMLPGVAASKSPDVAERARKILAGDPELLVVRVWLNATLAGQGDEEALAVLRTSQKAETVGERDVAVRALATIGEYEALAETLFDEPAPRLRVFAANRLAEEPFDDRIRGWLERGLQDTSPDVRYACLQALAREGDSTAIERAKSMLDPANPVALDQAVRALAEQWHDSPELAEDVFARLLGLYEREGRGRRLNESKQLLQNIGRIPLAQATAFLYELAVAAEGEVAGVRAQRWMLLQSGNGGPTAQRWLKEQLARETDPTLRMDVLEALSAPGGDVGRELLIELLAEPGIDPYEQLYIAGRLVRIGPAAEVAWRLKRLCLRIEEPTVRRAMRCLLWTWYPGPDES